MDPNETLRMAREARDLGDYEDAAMYYADLDDWLQRGGFLPDEWQTLRPVYTER